METATTRRARCARAGLAAVAAVLLAGCGGSAGGSPAVPALSQSAAQSAAVGQGHGGIGASRAAALHAVGQCIRQHGIPSYQDPVLSPSGQVYTDQRSLQDAPPPVLVAAQQACGALAAQAGLNPENEPPAPPQLVLAGVRSAECMRANGLPNVQDPTAQSPYTPGHGFGLSASEVPPGGKAGPAWQHAAHACRSLLDAEIQASALTSLGQ